MPGLGVDGGDHPVLGDPAGDPEHPVLAGLEVLAQHRGQQRRGLARPPRPARARPAPPGTAYPSRARESINSSRAAGSSQSICGFAVAGVVIATRQHRPQLDLAGPRSATRSSPRIAERINVIVSIVATASYNGVESSTRRRPTNPAACGRLQRHLEDPPRRAEPPTAPACPPAPCARTASHPVPSYPPTPAAYRQRASKAYRSTASRSDEPSNRCNTITVATTDGGTDRRPRPGEQIGEQLIREQPVPLPMPATA